MVGNMIIWGYFYFIESVMIIIALHTNLIRGRRKVIRLCANCACIFAIVSAFMTTAPLLILLRFLVGLL